MEAIVSHFSSCNDSLGAIVSHVNPLMYQSSGSWIIIWSPSESILLYLSFINLLGSSKSSVSCINNHYINLLVVRKSHMARVSHILSNNRLRARLSNASDINLLIVTYPMHQPSVG